LGRLSWKDDLPWLDDRPLSAPLELGKGNPEST
jgi:hypothetical protein